METIVAQTKGIYRQLNSAQTLGKKQLDRNTIARYRKEGLCVRHDGAYKFFNCSLRKPREQKTNLFDVEKGTMKVKAALNEEEEKDSRAHQSMGTYWRLILL